MPTHRRQLPVERLKNPQRPLLSFNRIVSRKNPEEQVEEEANCISVRIINIRKHCPFILAFNLLKSVRSENNDDDGSDSENANERDDTSQVVHYQL
jgi:hypothetical protein